jgi:hypothetical protein
MRLNALCLIGSLAALAIPLPAGSVGGGSIRAVGSSSSRHRSTRQARRLRLSSRLLLGPRQLCLTRQIQARSLCAPLVSSA